MALKQPYKDWLQPLAAEEFEALRADIKLRGVLQPILVDEQDNILDGHHRYRCDKNAATVVVPGLTEAEKQAFVMSSNNRRRNLTPEQKAENRKRNISIAKLLKEEDPKKWTQAKIAVALGVDGDTVGKWLDVSIPNDRKASIDARTTVPKPARADLVARVEAGESHAQVAADYGVSRGRVTQIVSQEKRRAEIMEKLTNVDAIEQRKVNRTYDVIVIDPPWPMEKIERDVRPNQMAFDYPTMDEAELCELHIPAADVCHLWMWTTHRFLPMSFRLLEAWQFAYVCAFVWHKPGGFQPVGLPQYNCEFCLYAKRGSPKFLDTKAFSVCFDAPRGKHSEKPDAFYDMVRRVTGGARLDMFNRRAIDGFDGWGKEAPE